MHFHQILFSKRNQDLKREEARSSKAESPDLRHHCLDTREKQIRRPPTPGSARRTLDCRWIQSCVVFPIPSALKGKDNMSVVMGEEQAGQYWQEVGRCLEGGSTTAERVKIESIPSGSFGRTRSGRRPLPPTSESRGEANLPIVSCTACPSLSCTIAWTVVFPNDREPTTAAVPESRNAAAWYMSEAESSRYGSQCRAARNPLTFMRNSKSDTEGNSP